MTSVLSSDYEARLDDIAGHYDLVVVGGGIYGAAVIWEAASRGLRAVLLEKGDFSEGTSANTLKTIHGGVRYLQTLDFPRMRESIKERRALLRIAPHLVSPLQYVIPTYRGLGKSKFVLWAGFTLYDLVSIDRNRGLSQSGRIPPGKSFSLSQFQAFLPGVQDERITGGAGWHDAQLYNSERLVLAFIMSAKRSGADVFSYLAQKDLLIDRGRIKGVVAEDGLSGKSVEISSETVIDCTGPWARQTASYSDYSGNKAGKRLTKAINIVVDRPISPYAVGISPRINSENGTPGQLLFICPWRDGSMIGTWYQESVSSPDDLSVGEEDLLGFLSQINSVIPSLQLKLSDISFVHQGMLPVSRVDRKTGRSILEDKFRVLDAQLHGGPDGLYWVQGVKYTTARHVASNAVDAIADRVTGSVKPSISEVTPLYGGDIGDFQEYLQVCLNRYSGQFSEPVIERLARNYGTKIKDISHYVKKDSVMRELVPGTLEVVQAELHFVVENEMTYTLSDLLLRRTDIGSFRMPADETIDFCADLLARKWGWDSAMKIENIKSFIRRYPAHCRGWTKPSASDDDALISN